MNRNQNDGIDLKKYKMDLAQTLIREVFVVLSQEQKNKGEQFSHELAMTLLGSFISTYLFNFLRDNAITAGHDPNAVWDAYKVIKTHLETSIQQGFEAGFHQFNPQSHPEYQCDITLLSAGIDPGKNNS